jgi:hypothetical protein
VESPLILSAKDGRVVRRAMVRIAADGAFRMVHLVAIVIRGEFGGVRAFAVMVKCWGAKTVRAVARTPTSQNRVMGHPILWKGLDMGQATIAIITRFLVSRSQDPAARQERACSQRTELWRQQKDR